MSDPTRAMIHLDRPLSDIAIAYVPEEESFIADKVFPSVPVDKQSDKYYIWTKGFWLRNSVERRTPGDTFPEGRLQLSNDEYYADEYHLGFPIPDEDRQNADPGIELETSGAEWLKTQFWLNREIQLVADAFVINKWATDVVGGTDFTVWDNYDESNPVSDIQLGKQTIQKSTGKKANTLVIGKEVFDTLSEHPNLLEKYKYTAEGILDEEQVRKALKVDRLVVGEAVYESTAEGATTATRGYIWGKNALLLHVPASPGLRIAAAGYTFEWRVDGAGGLTIAIENIREDNRRRDFLTAIYAFDNKVTGSDLGYFFSACDS